MTVQPADRPGTGLLAYSLAYGRQQYSWTLPPGGSAALPLALARLIEEHGGTILCDRRVTGLVLEDGRCVGVETADGEQHLASRAVLSTVHPAHLLEMAPRDAWGRLGIHRRDVARGRLPLPDPPRDDGRAGIRGRRRRGRPRRLRDRAVRRPAAPPRLGRRARAPRRRRSAAPRRLRDGRRPVARAGRAARPQSDRIPSLRARRRRLRAVGRGQGGRGREEPRAAPPVRAEPHPGDGPGAGGEEPGRPRTDERPQLARHPPRRRPRPGPVGREPLRAGNADPRPLPDRRHDAPRRLRVGGAGAQHRDRPPRGARQLARAGRGAAAGA